ncbi:MAG: T9SS type A sorting domain-containing protein, partial [Prevotellaceae bacterium]|nr:T9SS type A sorting domain-containing protein [Prevotellaceae bacterium]
ANPGFERWSGVTPEAWTLTGSCDKDTVNVRSGKYALKIATTSDRVDMRQTVHGVVAGQYYTISFWYYIEELYTSTGIRIWSNFYSGATPIASDRILQPTSYQRATDKWTQFVIDYTAPDSADSFNFEVRIMNGVTVYFDDFHFAEAKKAMPSISVTPDSLSFVAFVGDNISQSVQVTTVDISENLTVRISGGDASSFNIPAMLESDTSKALTVAYVPDIAGSHSATLTIAGGGVSCSVLLTGVASNAPLPVTITPISSIYAGGDTSPYSEQRVTIAGIVTAITKSKNFFVQSGSGAQSGIYVHRRGNLVRVGDSVLVAGWVSESGKLTEIAVNNDADISVVSSMRALPLPTPIAINQMSKAYHGVLLCLDSVEVAAYATGDATYTVGSGDNTLVVAQDIATTQPAAGAVVNIIGVGFYNGGHQLLPRSESDVQIVRDASSTTAAPKLDEHSVAVYPNPAGSFLHIKSAYGVATVEVCTLSGVAVLRKEAVSLINTASLKSGIYIVRVTFVNGASLAKVIVKR